jgi:hypothetical protein
VKSSANVGQTSGRLRVAGCVTLGNPMNKAGSPKSSRNPHGRAGEPISLHPLSFEDAVAGLAQVKTPEPEKKKPKAKPKKASS